MLAELNKELCRDNDAGMFVTLFYGLLHLRTGELEYSSGGHNPPYVLLQNGAVEVLPQTGGRALGVLEDAAYRAKQITLRAGDGLFLYTDGVTEAMDSASTLFSEQRLETVLQQAHQLSPTEVMQRVISAVKQFTRGAEQSDDITALALHYRGAARHDEAPRSEHTSILFKNQLSEITRLGQVVEAFAALHALPSKLAFELNVALEEILTNVISYGYADSGAHDILLRLSYTGEVVTAAVEDDGRPFNPLVAPPPDISKPLAERPIGGLGIHLVRKFMDRVEYQRREGKNLLVMTKRVATK